MAFLNFGKNKSENSSQEKIQVKGDYTIKVLGSGCKSCQTLFSNLQDAVKNLDIKADTVHVTDMAQLAEYGIMTTPALVINDKVVSTGKVLKSGDIEKLIVKFDRGE